MASGFETVPVADLEDLRDAIILALGRGLNAISLTIGGRSLQRASIKDMRDLLRDITQEIAARTDQTGGIGFIEFGESV
jgi:hypothetical protein